MKSFAPYLIMGLVLVVFVVGVIYLSKRFTWYFGSEQSWYYYVGFGVLAVFMIGGLIGFSNAISWIGHSLYVLAALATAFLLYLLFSVIFVDILSLLLNIPPRVFGIGALSLAGLIVLLGFWNSFTIRTTTLDISIKDLQQEIKAVHLSDIHIGHFRGKRFMEEVVQKTNRHQPDVIFLTGDLLDGKIALKKENFEPFKQFNAPVYFVEGNHDIYTGVTEIKSQLRNVGVIVLENQVADFEDLQIVGLNHMLAEPGGYDMHNTNQKLTIKEVLPTLDINPDKVNILLHHSPDGADYAEQAGIDLYLSGHTHGGQQFPVTWVNNLIFKYNKGLHELNNMKIFVSKGIGTFGPPVRVGSRSEIVVLNLKAIH